MSESSVPVRIVSGSPTAEELAAVLAVVGEAYADESAAAVASPARGRSRWELSARGLRAPLSRERGWGGFAG